MFLFLCTKLFQKRGLYSREDIIQRGTLFKEIRYATTLVGSMKQKLQRKLVPRTSQQVKRRHNLKKGPLLLHYILHRQMAIHVQ